VTSIPFLVDTVGGMRSRPLTVYATRATIEILRNHLFNWAIWPEFTEIPSPASAARAWSFPATPGPTMRCGWS
jgi:cAMP phosphodiesterase